MDRMSKSPYRLLVVEDENVVAMDLRSSLIQLGYEVVETVATGRQAIECVSREHPDLVLMDVRLRGDMDGIQAAEEIGRMGVPVVYLTAFSDKSTLDRAKITGPLGYLLKPFDERELHIVIEMAVHRHRAQKQHDQLVREQAERAALEEEHRWAQFLADASTKLSSSLDLQTTLEAIAQLAVPMLADLATVHARTERGFETLAIHHGHGKEGLLYELSRRYPPIPELPHGVPLVIWTGRPELIPEVTEEFLRAAAQDQENLELLRALGVKSQMCVPLASRGETWGALTLAYAESGRRYDDEDLARAVDLAGRCSIALDNARLYQQAKEATAHREKLVQDLERTVRFSEQFVGMLGHDLRNPLFGITAAASLITRRADSEAIGTPARRILISASRMERMIEQLLDFTRIRLGKGVPIERRRVSLREICELVVGEFEQTGESAVHIQSVGDVVGNWDADRLSQLLSNLVGNALLHGTGGVWISLDGTEADYVTLRVANPGGISKEMLPVIFEPFRSAADKKQERSSGLGLGLHISQQIVSAHGGSIEVTSSESEETCFTVRLPRDARISDPTLRIREEISLQ
jgi:signal transduction histidine kinase